MKFINIYIEKYEPLKKEGVVRYTIDFNSEYDAQLFHESLGEQKSDNENTPKFYELTMPHQGKNIMYEGSWYALPSFYFKDVNATRTSINPELEEEGGCAYWRKYHFDRGLSNYSFYLTEFSPLDYYNEKDEEISFSSEFNELHVVDCGQGNWNEVWSDENIIIYDLGASSKYSEVQIKTLIQKRFKNFGSKSVIIYISHWDMDHFQALKYLSKSDFSKIKCIYGPSNIPNTLVYSNSIANILDNKIPLHIIPHSRHRVGRQISLNLLESSKYVDLYRATSGRSRNQTGIVLAIKGKEFVALLTGDHHYCKIIDAIRGHYTSRNAILVAPHHGGEAGKIELCDWHTELSTLRCAISVGENSYGHPHKNLMNLIELADSRPDVTLYHGDLTYAL